MINLEYKKGLFPVSTGISLALERLDKKGIKHEEDPMRPEEEQLLKAATHLYINVRTLYRSVWSSLEELIVEPADLANTLCQEIDMIKLTLDGSTDFKLTPVFYFPSYDSLGKVFPMGRLYSANTELAKERLKLEKDTYANMPSSHVAMIEQCDVFLEGGSGNALMLTHYPSDLLVHEDFASLALLESNTGRIKPRSQFSTKLVKERGDAVFLPFNKMTLTVFGDGNKLLRAYAQGPKKHLLEIAKRNKWNSFTTNERIIYCLNNEADVLFAKTLRNML